MGLTGLYGGPNFSETFPDPENIESFRPVLRVVFQFRKGCVHQIENLTG